MNETTLIAHHPSSFESSLGFFEDLDQLFCLLAHVHLRWEPYRLRDPTSYLIGAPSPLKIYERGKNRKLPTLQQMK
jgi:hypothetical protein